MACAKCDQPAVTSIRYSGQRLCRQHFLHFFEKRAKMNVAQQGRLPHGRIAVALSGGKDSVACLHFLAKISRDNPHVELVAISVDEGIAGYREDALRIAREVTHKLGVAWHVVRTEDLAGYSIDAYAAGSAGPTGQAAQKLRVAEPVAAGGAGAGPANGAAMDGPGARPSCGPCGVFRRLGINRMARELGASAVATGHNLDDTAQTILMNVVGGDLDRLSRLAPHDHVQPGMVPRILPFRNIPEKEVLLYCLLEDLPVHDEECPYAARANRFAMRDMLLELEAKQPGTRHSILRFHDRLRQAMPVADGAAVTCPSCGEPTSGTSCRACLWRVTAP